MNNALKIALALCAFAASAGAWEIISERTNYQEDRFVTELVFSADNFKFESGEVEDYLRSKDFEHQSATSEVYVANGEQFHFTYGVNYKTKSPNISFENLGNNEYQAIAEYVLIAPTVQAKDEEEAFFRRETVESEKLKALKLRQAEEKRNQEIVKSAGELLYKSFQVSCNKDFNLVKYTIDEVAVPTLKKVAEKFELPVLFGDGSWEKGVAMVDLGFFRYENGNKTYFFVSVPLDRLMKYNWLDIPNESMFKTVPKDCKIVLKDMRVYLAHERNR